MQAFGRFLPLGSETFKRDEHAVTATHTSAGITGIYYSGLNSLRQGRDQMELFFRQVQQAPSMLAQIAKGYRLRASPASLKTTSPA
jgi:hypothetical protein